MINFQLKCKSNTKETLYNYKEFLQTILRKNNLLFTFFALPKKKKRIVLLKSPHVYKKAKEHFEKKTFFFVISISISLINLKIIFLNKPKNIRFIIKKI